MTSSRRTPAAEVKVLAASPEDEPVLANLLELYSHDFSEFIELTLGPDGRFGYEHLHSYWEEPGRHPFIITADRRLAGFAFVRKGSEISNDAEVWDMAEFFVARGLRRHGVGTKAAREVWVKFPGRWEVRVSERNQKAKEFWRRAIDEFLGEACEPTPHAKDGQIWHVFSFESANA
jgi:predicted acetyltransferase